MSFSCVAKGSFHQGNEQLFPTSRNSQCTAISACAIAWKTLRLEFSTAAIDTILITGDNIYCTLRDENRMGGNRYLCPDELPSNFVIQGQDFAVVENSFVHDALYPLAEGDMGESIVSLSNVLEYLMAENVQDIGFLFTGQTVTVAFWRSQDQLYLFDPHPVDDNRKHDLDNDNNNLARLFQCESYSALASLLLSNAALDGSVRQFTVTRLRFCPSTLSANEPVPLPTVTPSPLTSVAKRKAIGRPIAHGPMAHWNGVLLFNIYAYKLKKTCLWDDDVLICSHCQAPLFEEEEERRKWCCGEGAYNVTSLPPLNAPFYSNRRFLDRARAYNDLFALCALEISGGYRHPSGLSFFKIEGRMYHQVYSLDAPGQKFVTKGGDVQLVNRCRLYIDDGEERRNMAMSRSLDATIVDDIKNYLDSQNPYVHEFRRLSDEPSVNAHLDFQITSRATHGPVLGDRQRGVEVHAVLIEHIANWLS
ncbi:hypothetical protein J6590_105359, partial [Homalodisca vitripennis]